MSSVGTMVPVPRKEQVLPQGTQSPGVGECKKKKIEQEQTYESNLYYVYGPTLNIKLKIYSIFPIDHLFWFLPRLIVFFGHFNIGSGVGQKYNDLFTIMICSINYHAVLVLTNAYNQNWVSRKCTTNANFKYFVYLLESIMAVM